ncbi:MAG: biopolymer transporter ExbD [Deltaproteobacteria bacterium]|nr:biopolymer transporter ExbD [Deltaproteobacteria bacterium]
MGMSGGGGGTSKNVSADINVTPLIDVLLVLLIIFLVVMPIMMKMETLTIPRKLDDQNEQPDKDASMLNLKVLVIGDVVFNDGNADEVIKAAELLGRLRPKIEGLKAGIEKVVFVDFEDGVPWATVVTTMDQIRSLATDANHDDVKVALKVREEPKPGAAQ